MSSGGGTRAIVAALGLTQIPRYANFAWVYAVAIVTVFVIWRVAYSAAGRAIMADDMGLGKTIQGAGTA